MRGTLPRIYRPLMYGETVEAGWCVVCGRPRYRCGGHHFEKEAI